MSSQKQEKLYKIDRKLSKSASQVQIFLWMFGKIVHRNAKCIGIENRGEFRYFEKKNRGEFRKIVRNICIIHLFLVILHAI